MVFLTWVVFAPYYLWLFRNLLLNKMPPYPWPAVIGLTYIPLGVVFLVFVHRKIYKKELADSQIPRHLGSNAPASVPGVIWISSLHHLKRFRDLPWYANWFGLLPDGFPRVRAGLLFNPLLYSAQATLSLDGGSFKCSAFVPSPHQGLKSYSNLASDFHLHLVPNQVLSVSRFDMRQIVPAALPLPFIRIQTTSGELNDLLVCAGSDDVSAIGRETESLWHALSAFVSKRGGG